MIFYNSNHNIPAVSYIRPPPSDFALQSRNNAYTLSLTGWPPLFFRLSWTEAETIPQPMDTPPPTPVVALLVTDRWHKGSGAYTQRPGTLFNSCRELLCFSSFVIKPLTTVAFSLSNKAIDRLSTKFTWLMLRLLQLPWQLHPLISII